MNVPEKNSLNSENEFTSGPDKKESNKLIIITICLGGLLFLLGISSIGYWYWEHNITLKEMAERIAFKKGVYSTDKILAILEEANKGNEFAFLQFLKDSSAINVYKDLLDYGSKNREIKDNLEKLYFLNIHRAEKSERKENYKRARAYYKIALKIKPGGREAINGLRALRKRFTTAHKAAGKPKARTREKVYETVQSKMSLVKYLYDKERRIFPGIKGKINVEFTIRPDGTIKDARILNSTVGNASLEHVLIKHIKMWEFVKSIPDDGDMTLVYPFVFY